MLCQEEQIGCRAFQLASFAQVNKRIVVTARKTRILKSFKQAHHVTGEPIKMIEHHTPAS